LYYAEIGAVNMQISLFFVVVVEYENSLWLLRRQKKKTKESNGIEKRKLL
jgi:hypothetical protein